MACLRFPAVFAAAVLAFAAMTVPVPVRAAPLEGPPMTVEVCHTFAPGKTDCYSHTRRMNLEYRFVDFIVLNQGYEADMTITAREVWKACKVVVAGRTINKALKTSANACRFISGARVPFKVMEIGYNAYLRFHSGNPRDYDSLPKGYFAEVPAVSACTAEPCEVSRAQQDAFCTRQGFGAAVLAAERLDLRGQTGFEGIEDPISFRFIDDASRTALQGQSPDSRRFERASAVWMLRCNADAVFRYPAR